MTIYNAKDANGNTCRYYVEEIGPSGGKSETYVAYQLFKGRNPLALVARHTEEDAIADASAYLATINHPFPMNLAL